MVMGMIMMMGLMGLVVRMLHYCRLTKDLQFMWESAESP